MLQQAWWKPSPLTPTESLSTRETTPIRYVLHALRLFAHVWDVLPRSLLSILLAMSTSDVAYQSTVAPDVARSSGGYLYTGIE